MKKVAMAGRPRKRMTDKEKAKAKELRDKKKKSLPIGGPPKSKRA